MLMDTMRDRFVAVTTELLHTDPSLAVVLADIGVSKFADSGATTSCPDRVINVGIREQLMVGVGAGLALEGLRPIIHTYAPFLVERAYEQVKLDLSHQDVGAILVTVGASYDAAASGRTHHAPADIVLMAALPGWDIAVPGHPDELEHILRSAAAAQGRTYIRLAEDSNVTAGAGDLRAMSVVRRGSPRAPVVVAVGPMLTRTLEATKGMDITVLYAVIVRPWDGATLRRFTSGSEIILVEPYLAGTSTAEVAAALVDRPHRTLAIGVGHEDPRRYGTRWEHDSAHGLDAAGIRGSISRFLDGAGASHVA